MKTVVIGVVVDLLGRLIGLVERKANKPSDVTPITHSELEDLQRKARALRDMRNSN